MKSKKLLGTTAKAIATAVDNDSQKTVQSGFFKPYKSPSNVFFRTTSIITDPLLLAGGTAFFALLAGFELLKSLGSLITANRQDAKESLKESGEMIVIAGMLLIAAIASPLVNLVDLIGGGVTSLKQNLAVEETQHQPQFN